jgi:hypothetical protein
MMDGPVMIRRADYRYEVKDSEGFMHTATGSLQILGDYVIIGGQHTFFRPRWVKKI